MNSAGETAFLPYASVILQHQFGSASPDTLFESYHPTLHSLIRPDVPSLHGLDGFRACPPCGQDREKLYVKTSGMQSSLPKVKYDMY